MNCFFPLYRTYFFFFLLSKSPLPASPPKPPMLSLGTISGSPA